MNIDKIREHYEHAKKKHPYFCDVLDRFLLSSSEYAFKHTEKNLKFIRTDLFSQIRCGLVDAMTVLNCEEREIEYAIVRGEVKNAVEECYDAIAVLLRMVDVLEGRQALGDPAKKGGK